MARAGHIISRCNWMTCTEDRDTALKLQEHLSTWSNSRLMQEALTVFDELCPPEQTWKISRLEIDLGEIDFDQMEPLLTERFIGMLREKLCDHAIWESDDKVFAVAAITNYTEMLESFLLYGILPWNYRSQDGSVNDIFKALLSSHFPETIALVRAAGRSGVRVRKRIAWQISEPNLRTIISGLEPVSSPYILQFSKDLTTIQENQTIVHAGLQDFKHNLWLTILNYLLDERGSVFNRKSFMRSNIRQMAAHYNIRYEQLLEMIARAIAAQQHASAVQPELITILSQIAAEHVDTETGPQRTESHWEVLASFMQTPNLDPGGYDVDDLVNSLSVENADRFCTIMKDSVFTAGKWLKLTTILGEEATGAIFSVLNKTYSSLAMNTCIYMQKSIAACNLYFDKKQAFALCASHLGRSRGRAFDAKVLLKQLLILVGGSNQISYRDLALKLLGTSVPLPLRSATFTQVHDSLFSLFAEEQANDHPWLARNSRGALSSLYLLLTSGRTDKRRARPLQTQLKKIIQVHPAGFIKFMQAHPNRKAVETTLPYLLDETTVKKLMQESSVLPHRSLLNYVHELVLQRRTAAKLLFTAGHVIDAGLLLMILHPADTAEVFLDRLIDKLAGSDQFKRNELTVLMIVGTGDAGVEMPAAMRALGEKVGNKSAPLLSNQPPIAVQGRSSAACADIIASFLAKPDCALFLKSPASAALAKKVISGGTGLLRKLQREVTEMLLVNGKILNPLHVQHKLSVLAWKCLAQYEAHKGDTLKLRELYRTTAQYHFAEPVTGPSATGRLPVTSAMVILSSGILLQHSEVLQMLKHCLPQGGRSVDYQGTKVSVNELLHLAFETDAHGTARMIGEFPALGKHLDTLRSVISFRDFCSIASAADSRSRNGIIDVVTLYGLSQQLNASVPAGVERIWWQTVCGVLRQRELKRGDATIIVRQLGGEVPRVRRRIIKIIDAGEILLTPLLVEIFTAEFALPSGSIKLQPARGLEVLFRKGLLSGLVKHLLVYRKLPLWMDESGSDVPMLLKDIIHHYPAAFLSVFRNTFLTDAQMQGLLGILSLESLIPLSENGSPERVHHIGQVSQLYAFLNLLPLKQVSADELQQVILKKLLKACASRNSNGIVAANILSELLWYAAVKKGYSEAAFLSLLHEHRSMLSPGWRAVLKEAMSHHRGHGPVLTPEQGRSEKNLPAAVKETLRQGITIQNAGLVLLNDYLPLLFQRMELMQENIFYSELAVQHAVHCLQYLVTGSETAEEAHLPLNKLLCGLELFTPVSGQAAIHQAHRQLMDGLLEAVMAHWPSNGSSTVDGFRGNWIIRTGILRDADKHWELTVERRAYDVLLAQAPFSISVINYPWMPKPINVKWKY